MSHGNILPTRKTKYTTNTMLLLCRHLIRERQALISTRCNHSRWWWSSSSSSRHFHETCLPVFRRCFSSKDTGLFTTEDVQQNPDDTCAAGAFPYTRGPYKDMYVKRPWTIRQYAGFSSAEESNTFYKRNLEKGQHGLSVAFDLPTHRGYDSDNPIATGDVGLAGVPVDTVEDVKILFDGIPLDTMSVSMTMNGAVLPIMAYYIVAAEEQGVKDLSCLQGTIQNDILKEFMVRNTYIYPPKESLEVTSHVIEYCAEHMPKFHPISISGYHMQEAGAAPALELAYTLANGLEYLNLMPERVDDVAPKVSFFFGLGMNFFSEVAKLRAARRMWAKLVKERFSPKNPKSMVMRMHCQTSGYSLTAQQPYNNIIRTTIEAMSGIFGGTQSLHTNSFDEAVALPTEFSADLARATQLILMEETGFTDVIDPLGGSYYVEHLTDALEHEAMEIIKHVTEMGGMTEAILAGIPQRRIEESAIVKQARIDSGKDVIVGLNTFSTGHDDHHHAVEARRIDNEKALKTQLERLKKVKSSRNDVRVKECLKDLEEKKGNLLELSIRAARERATVEEITHALEKSWGRYEAKSSIATGMYSKINAGEMTTQIEDFEREHGRRPRILIAKMGLDGHDRGAKVMASGLADIGFDVDIGPLFMSPKDVAQHAIDADVHIIGISTQAAAHRTMIPELMEELRRLVPDDEEVPIVVCGGIIPEEDHHDLFKHGVKAMFGPGTTVPQAASDLVHLLQSQ